MDELEAMIEGLEIAEPTPMEELQELLRTKTEIEQELLSRHEVLGARTEEGRELHSRLAIVKESIERVSHG